MIDVTEQEILNQEKILNQEGGREVCKALLSLWKDGLIIAISRDKDGQILFKSLLYRLDVH